LVDLLELCRRARPVLGGEQPVQHRAAVLHHRLGLAVAPGLLQGESGMTTSVNTIETSGSTVDEAVLKALEELEEARENVQVEVLQEAPEARVRVTLRETYAIKARQVVAELLYKMGISAQVFIKKSDDPVMIDVAGEHLAMLIGRRGATLRASQPCCTL